jgi:hypothetical protein
MCAGSWLLLVAGLVLSNDDLVACIVMCCNVM